MATIVDSPTTATAAVILGSLGTACSDVVVDSIVVERSRDQGQVQFPQFPRSRPFSINFPKSSS